MIACPVDMPFVVGYQSCLPSGKSAAVMPSG
jgi:hypothetical protein